MEVYSIGFTKHTAEDFFTTLERANVRRLIDVRLNNVSQLSGFSKRDDLRYFLKRIAGIEYSHELALAPTADLLNAYKKKEISWHSYAEQYLALLDDRSIERQLDAHFFEDAVLLCSEHKPERCHRRLALEYLGSAWSGMHVVHL